ncbi:MAG: hypothetical protein ACERJ1_08550 [Halodesulfovibrio sp.]|uniref:hypothetical protein n=1 Tax=Halodesulfovibrio sp. TaxID=1912772 RepID=UPI00359E91C2
MRNECVEMVEGIFKSGIDRYWPVPEGRIGDQIRILASKGGYFLQANYEPKKYNNAEEVLTALIAVEKDVYRDDSPLESVHQNLKMLS